MEESFRQRLREMSDEELLSLHDNGRKLSMEEFWEEILGFSSHNDQGEPRREPETNPQAASSASAPPLCCAVAEPLRDGTLLDRQQDPVEDDFEIPFDLLSDNPSPYFDARLSTIGALFITYDPNWNDKLFGWMEDAEKRGELINKNGTVTCHPFQLSSSDNTNP